MTAVIVFVPLVFVALSDPRVLPRPFPFSHVIVMTSLPELGKVRSRLLHCPADASTVVKLPMRAAPAMAQSMGVFFIRSLLTSCVAVRRGDPGAKGIRHRSGWPERGPLPSL